jgi:polysaccharide biosynthesis/export protein
MKKRNSLLAVVSLVLLFGSTLLFGQNRNSDLSSATANAQAGAYYYVARPNEMNMQVNIWGFVHHPGRYEVNTGTDLVQLLSYAGGPTNDADMEDVRVSRIVRRDGVVSTKEIRLDLKNMEKLDEAKLQLQPGDTVFLDHTSWLTIRDIVSVVTTAAIVTAAVAQIMNYSK